MNWWDKFDTFKKEAFRLETLPEYSIDADRERFEAYLSGEMFPQEKYLKGDWHKTIAAATARAAAFRRVHVVPKELNPYLRFEIEWGYCYNAQFVDDIRIMSWEKVTNLIVKEKLYDFWLFDEEELVQMEYGAKGEFLGAGLVEKRDSIEECRRVRDELWGVATPLREFLSEKRRSGR